MTIEASVQLRFRLLKEEASGPLSRHMLAPGAPKLGQNKPRVRATLTD